MQEMWGGDQGPERLDLPTAGGAQALLGQASRSDAAEADPALRTAEDRFADLGEFMILLLASTLAGLRDRLYEDGFESAADLVADLAEAADDYVTRTCD